ncbi:DUF6924 domain-containing protein [Nocardia macrotermitis]|uniref:DUF6924 domain-containing protein n=1 Tax=Nocardia macrotermitis TaxID=2585198 RepID=A0A7K0D3W8_9NOCA|nr:hypothetical protein [Nocardia macrotermitis]MQY19604.1 hypothetical protein [Nocardia macrotermitis]
MFVLPETVKAVLIRTDFSDQQAWEACRSAIDAAAMAAFDTSVDEDVEILDDPANRDLTADRLLALESLAETDHTFVMLVDGETLSSTEYPVLFLDLFEDQRGATVRVVAAELSEAVGNVDNGNITIQDYAAAAENAGDKGVFRGFA